jgi:ABC-type bacteriocin/lantibiotic exporter with double-glycine peptidase domain
MLMLVVCLAYHIISYSIPAAISTFSITAGEIHRVGEMIEVLDDIRAKRRERHENGQTVDDNIIALERVNVRTPDGSRVLFKDLNIRITRKESVLITGPSGTDIEALHFTRFHCAAINTLVRLLLYVALCTIHRCW